MTPAVQEPVSITAKNLGHFQPWSAHLLRPSPSEDRISRIGRASRGLAVVRTQLFRRLLEIARELGSRFRIGANGLLGVVAQSKLFDHALA